MRHWLSTISAAAIVASGPAFAADLGRVPPAPLPPPVPVFTWTGFYIGMNVGGEWDRSATNSPLVNSAACGVSSPCYISSVVADINNQAAKTVTSSGVVGGVQAGYNLQFSSLVVGLEADFDSFRSTGLTTTSAAFTGFPVSAGGTTPTYTNSIETNWLFTARGRLGFTPSSNLLVYGTGGLAMTDFGYRHTFAEGVFTGTSGGTETASVTENKTGYALGAGLEYALSENWSLKAEYLYVNFGKISTAQSPVIFAGSVVSGSVFSHTADLSANIVRIGLNYRFGGPAAPAVTASY